MAVGRRFSRFVLKIVGRHPSDYASELEDTLKAMWNQMLGIPTGGFFDTAATVIRAGVASAAGLVTSGWAAADHVHQPETGAGAATGKVAAEGSGSALLRADATVAQGVVAAKGDVLTHDGSTAERLPVLPGEGHVLSTAPGEVTGLKWIPGLTTTEVETIREILGTEDPSSRSLGFRDGAGRDFGRGRVIGFGFRDGCRGGSLFSES